MRALVLVDFGKYRVCMNIFGVDALNEERSSVRRRGVAMKEIA